MKFNANFCTSLSHQRLTFQTFFSLVKYSTGNYYQLISSSFKRTQIIFRYAFGRRITEARSPSVNCYSIVSNKAPQVNNYTRLSLLSRWYQQQQNQRKSELFKQVRRWGGSGVSLSLVGVYIKGKNGYPVLTPEENSINWTQFFTSVTEKVFDLKEVREDVNSIDLIQFNDNISTGSQGSVYKAQIKSKAGDKSEDVAVKMCFNFSIESNAMSIINATIKECIPYNGNFASDVIVPRRRKLPPHPNIVKILSVFADQFVPLKECNELFPAALPRSLGGYGRNMTLFIIEKIYDMSLKNYLKLYKPNYKQSLTMLTQCFNAIDFLVKNGIAHRDIKPDNILVNLNDEENDSPWIVLADFGLCSTELRLPYQTFEVCKGGNPALMAPEIKAALPGPFSTLDYTKSDLWAMGTIAYELFNGKNPFYNIHLDSLTYNESQLPNFPIECPIISQLIYLILSRDTRNRPTAHYTSELLSIINQLGVNKMKALLNCKQHREMKIAEWYRQFNYQTLYDIINGIVDKESTHFRMKLMFLTSFNVKRICNIFNDPLTKSLFVN